MSINEDAARLEALLPQVMSALFRSDQEDPLRHHSVGQIRLMRTLLRGSKTATELSHTLGLSPSSLTQMASRMISAGLVSKELDSHDRRVRKLSLTETGRSIMENRQAMRASAATRLLEKMDPQKRADLIELLEAIASQNNDQGYALLEAII